MKTVILLFVTFVLGNKAERELYKTLFNGYNKWIRPVEFANQTVVIKFELFIAQLVKIDEVRMRYQLRDLINEKTRNLM